MPQVNTKNLALDILANKQKYTVNPVEKMDRTIDKMCDNHVKKVEAGLTGNRKVDDSRGYGQGRNSGD